MELPQRLLEDQKKARFDLVFFAERFLGLPLSFHEGQVRWLKNSTRQINILRPGNKWGKSLVAAIKHLHHAVYKPLLGTQMTDEEMLKAKYDTLNFGPGYEQAREVLRMARDIVNGSVLIPESHRTLTNEATNEPYGVYNQSFFQGWFITEDKSEAGILPHLKFTTNVTLFGRSYDEMGVAFKMKSLAYISGDECADIGELWTFTNGTLLPRLSAFKNPSIDYYGTPQPEGFDYQRMIEMAEEDMKQGGKLFYTQRGSMYENPFLPKETIESFERIMDPTMKEQVIRGDFVQSGEKYFGFDRIQHAVDPNLEVREYGDPTRKYITGVDFAGGGSQWADHTVVITIDYTDKPWQVVYFKRVHGSEMPIPMQYQMVREVKERFPGHLIIDSSALGGKNAMAFLSDTQPISADFKPQGNSNYKGEMLAALKVVFDGGDDPIFRRTREKIDNKWVDAVENWGLIRLPNIPILIRELQNYKLEDQKLSTDCVMALGMAVHWLHLRTPKKQLKRSVELDFLGLQ